MKARCDNPNLASYSYYGGRGITYDPAWASFEAFFEHMGERPSPLHTLDRINCELNYTPDNCRWATRSEQVANRRQYFLRPTSDMRYIRKRRNRWRVNMTLTKGNRVDVSFPTLEEAFVYRANTEMEREIHRILSKAEA